jgi:hypothetical protein
MRWLLDLLKIPFVLTGPAESRDISTAEIPNPNFEILNNHKSTKHEIQIAGSAWNIWSFEFVSDFGIRISDFPSGSFLPRLGMASGVGSAKQNF